MTEEDIKNKIKNNKYVVRDFSDKVDWYNISWMQKLSEEFIREFKDKVDWKYHPRCYFNKGYWKHFL